MEARLEVLVNAAGHMRSGRFEQLDLAAHRDTLNCNLWTMLAVMHVAFPLLRDTECVCAISIASALGMYGTPDLASYSVVEAFVPALMQALNLEWDHYGIHVCDSIPPYVNAAAPGGTRTTRHRCGRAGSPPLNPRPTT